MMDSAERHLILCRLMNSEWRRLVLIQRQRTLWSEKQLEALIERDVISRHVTGVLHGGHGVSTVLRGEVSQLYRHVHTIRTS